MQNTFTIDADIKKTSYFNEPTVTSNDDITFVVNISDDGQAFDLASVTTMSLANTKPDKDVVVTSGAKSGTNQVTFVLGTNETAVSGTVNAVVQLYDADGRVSTLSFSYVVKSDPTGSGYVPSTDEQTLIEVVLNDGPLRIQEAIDAGIYANLQGDYALAQGDIAFVESANLSTLKTDVQTATDSANTATDNANSAATNANEKGNTAEVQGDVAEGQGIFAQTEGDKVAQKLSEVDTAITTTEIATTNAQNVADNTQFVEAYNSLTTYSKNNFVSLNGSSFMSLQGGNTGNAPNPNEDTLYWALIAKKGVDGTGSVSTVNAISPNIDGNVILDANDVGAETPTGAQIKADSAETNAATYTDTKAGDLTTLTTTNKTNLVAAVNENENTLAVHQADYANKFPDNSGAHNSIYRGEYLGTSLTLIQQTAISSGTFEGLYIGDYWTIGEINYRIAGFNYFRNVGDTALTANHVTIVPDTILYNVRMNATNVTTGGYVSSEMRTTNLASAITTIETAFPSRVIQHRQLLTNATTDGKASGWSWYASKVELMNEVMVYGSVAWGEATYNSGYNVGTGNGRLPLFAHRQDMVNTRQSYWLRDVVSATFFAFAYGNGYAGNLSASNAYGVRPAFSIS